MEAMNDKVNPCEDFYEYACGKWIEKNPIPADKSDFNCFSKLHNEIKLKLKGSNPCYSQYSTRYSALYKTTIKVYFLIH